MARTPSSSKRRQFTPRTRSVQDEQRPSRRLSVVLLGIGVAVTLLVASWLGFLNQSSDNKLEIKDVKISNSGEITLTGARYQGVTSSGQPFLITADQASESNNGSGHIDDIIWLVKDAIIRLEFDDLAIFHGDGGTWLLHIDTARPIVGFRRLISGY